MEVSTPPITTDASGLCTSEPAPTFNAIGTKPSDATSAVISTGRRRVSAPYPTVCARKLRREKALIVAQRALLARQLAAIGAIVKRKLMLLLVLVAMLFGVIAAPDTAHANDSAVDHAAVHQQAGEPDSPSPEDEASPCKAVVHHHCSMAIAGENRVDGAIIPAAAEHLLPFDDHALTSLSRAPPTQPPSA